MYLLTYLLTYLSYYVCVWSVEQAMQALQKQRQKLLSEMCEKYSRAINDTTEREYPRMYSNKKEQFLYCPVPKVKHRLTFTFVSLKMSLQYSIRAPLTNLNLFSYFLARIILRLHFTKLLENFPIY